MYSTGCTLACSWTWARIACKKRLSIVFQTQSTTRNFGHLFWCFRGCNTVQGVPTKMVDFSDFGATEFGQLGLACSWACACIARKKRLSIVFQTQSTTRNFGHLFWCYRGCNTVQGVPTKMVDFSDSGATEFGQLFTLGCIPVSRQKCCQILRPARRKDGPNTNSFLRSRSSLLLTGNLHCGAIWAQNGSSYWGIFDRHRYAQEKTSLRAA